MLDRQTIIESIERIGMWQGQINNEVEKLKAALAGSASAKKSVDKVALLERRNRRIKNTPVGAGAFNNKS